VDHQPPCCASCPELDQKQRACRLLSDPGPSARARLATMPCDVKRLLHQRFRGHGDDVARAAMASWESDRLDADAARRGLGPPVDARAWLSTWPVTALAIPALEERFPPQATVGEPLPEPTAKMLIALAQLHAVDPLSYQLVLDGLRGSFDAATWRAGLGVRDDALAAQVAFALLRAVTIYADIVPSIEPAPARVCFVERWLGHAERSEVAALARAREALGDPSLSMTAFRKLAQEGASHAIGAIGDHAGLSVVLSPDALRAFSRVLRLGDDGTEIGPFEEPLFAFFGQRLAEAGCRTPDAHAAAADLVRFAAAPGDQPGAASLIEHLACCRDERCPSLTRAEVMGTASVRRMLAGPMLIPSSWPARAPVGAPAGYPAAPSVPLPPAPPTAADDEEDTLPRGP